MALEKLTIIAETKEGKFKDEIKVLFNPNELSINKATNWRVIPKAERDTPKTQFTYGEPATLSIKLFFNTFEERKNVQDHTNKIFHLTTIEKHGSLHRPPLCKLSWGSFEFYDCEWILKSLNQQFTLFLDDGIPVRATLTCSFRQWRSDATEEKLLDKQSADVAKRRTVRLGDTLSSIAAEEYNDPGLWRPIARENRIVNPRILKPGQVLSIPVLGATP